ncbi:MAG TPA: PIN domain-containing protein [Solirubrobacterales bacterium]|nr:PIN domain-containing protein [Solirubrobacterales bacterium]
MSACVLDTDVVIAALDRADAHHGAAAKAFELWARDEVELLLCTVNYAESLVRPAGEEGNLRAAVEAIAALGIRLLAPDAAMARNAARHRGLGISLADGFALATATARDASVASFDKRVRRALQPAGLRLSPALG